MPLDQATPETSLANTGKEEIAKKVDMMAFHP
jgi:hypothetical protein